MLQFEEWFAMKSNEIDAGLNETWAFYAGRMFNLGRGWRNKKNTGHNKKVVT